jgi:hypothetical protein
MNSPTGLARVGSGVQGALLLARGRAEGMLLLAPRGEPARAAAARSFWAAALCLPAFICLRLVDLALSPHLPPYAAHGLALHLLGYVVDWVGFALLSRTLAHAMGRQEQWPRYIAAWNWCNVVQYLLTVAATLPALLGLPGLIEQTAWLVALGWGLWIEWYATRVALDVTGAQAAGLVLLDVGLGFGLMAVIALFPGGSL